MPYTRQDLVKDTVDAIKNLRIQARRAREAGDMITLSSLMGDLEALKICLVTDVERLIGDLEEEKLGGKSA